MRQAVAHHLAGVDAPGHVGQLRNLVRYRAGNAERRRLEIAGFDAVLPGT